MTHFLVSRCSLLVAGRLKSADRPVFGQYACAGLTGKVLRVGDKVEIMERVPISE